MNEAELTPAAMSEPRAPRRRRRLWNMAGLAVALIAMGSVLCFWGSSKGFENLVRGRLVAQLEEATGGRVEIASLHWHLFNLEAD